MKAQEDEAIELKLKKVDEWRESGVKFGAWVASQGVDAKQMSGWLANEKRWRARLKGEVVKRRCRAGSGRTRGPRLKAGQQGLDGSNQTQASAGARSAFAQLNIVAPSAGSGQVCGISLTQALTDSVRIEAQGAGLVLYWPVSASAALARWVQALQVKPQA